MSIPRTKSQFFAMTRQMDSMTESDANEWCKNHGITGKVYLDLSRKFAPLFEMNGVYGYHYDAYGKKKFSV
jgi:hypothetical protein